MDIWLSVALLLHLTGMFVDSRTTATFQDMVAAAEGLTALQKAQLMAKPDSVSKKQLRMMAATVLGQDEGNLSQQEEDDNAKIREQIRKTIAVEAGREKWPDGGDNGIVIDRQNIQSSVHRVEKGEEAAFMEEMQKMAQESGGKIEINKKTKPEL